MKLTNVKSKPLKNPHTRNIILLTAKYTVTIIFLKRWLSDIHLKYYNTLEILSKISVLLLNTPT